MPEDILIILAAIGFVGFMGPLIGLAIYYFSEITQLRGNPRPVDLNVHVTRNLSFTLERKLRRSFGFQRLLQPRPVAFEKTSSVFSADIPIPNVLVGGAIDVPLTGSQLGSGTYKAIAIGPRPTDRTRSKKVLVVVHKGYDYTGHPGPYWRWTKSNDAEVYELIGSERKQFVCFEYSLKKATWSNANSTPPSTSDDCDQNAIITGLLEAGYSEIPDAAVCGCGTGQNKYCVVIYETVGGDKSHCAVFDTVLCDWGGKMANDRPIMRFKTAADYLLTFDENLRKDVKMRFFCLDPGATPPDYISDERLFELAEEE